MMKFAVLFALVAAATAEPVARLNALSPTGRIVGGTATSIDEVPYQVSLQVYGSHFCGASIISENWILSAAHCMVYPISWMTVRSGSTLSNSGGVVSAITRNIDHAEYAENRFGVPVHDITLLQLRTPLTFNTNQAAIRLFSATQEAVVGTPAVITGWGALSEGGSSPIVLQTVTIPIISKSECDAAYTIYGGLPTGQICAAVPQGGMDACQGDSGGPLAINGVLAGVVSWGNGCARRGWPGAYTEVAAYRSWITQNSGV